MIAISRTLGAGGESLGEALADELGFRYVDSEIIDRAAALARVSPEEIAQAESRKGLLGRILDNIARSGSARGSGVIEPPPLESSHPGYEQLIVEVINETAAMKAVVIVAHGASIPLAGVEGVVRILVTASTDHRVRRVSAAEDVDLDRARHLVHDSDAARGDYFRRFYGLESELPTNYDLVFNTDVLSIDQAMAATLAVVRG